MVTKQISYFFLILTIESHSAGNLIYIFITFTGKLSPGSLLIFKSRGGWQD